MTTLDKYQIKIRLAKCSDYGKILGLVPALYNNCDYLHSQYLLFAHDPNIFHFVVEHNACIIAYGRISIARLLPR
jgi:hypothetical protein